ncbi:ABC transporter [Trypanosoma rangeli]|uniref:ABC transporter n=1 Tax=Trypanosoma rangeli TaxID=5698 RepID=A0A422NRD9_TRYRA|nr:ABC transporter [Trypanosoma rangeli]RNF08026.1 ABC transporter [Trypanosoma rangeli]|eukprot:RNF08026.1 ABC transporter [Trypanosoma rangeli]
MQVIALCLDVPCVGNSRRCGRTSRSVHRTIFSGRILPAASVFSLFAFFFFLCGKRDCKASALSGERKRRLSLAAVFVWGVPLVLLEGPTVGMAPVACRGVWTSIRAIVTKCPGLLITHHLDGVEALAGCVSIVAEMSLRIHGAFFCPTVERLV